MVRILLIALKSLIKLVHYFSEYFLIVQEIKQLQTDAIYFSPATAINLFMLAQLFLQLMAAQSFIYEQIRLA
jgi:hypothetical protein